MTPARLPEGVRHALVVTRSGSVYELDLSGSRVRRLEGTYAPPPWQEPDGVWRAYEELVQTPGGDLVFLWGCCGENVDAMVTTPVVRVETLPPAGPPS